MRRLVFAVSLTLSCRAPPKPAPPPRGPPAAEILVRHEHLTLRASESLELHAMLMTAARNDSALAPEFEPARNAYARAIADDEDDSLVRDTRLDPLAKLGLTNAFAPEWEKRSAITWAAIERAHAAMDDRAEGVLVTLSRSLGVTWSPGAGPVVDFVSESPPAGRKALLTPFLAARSPCFVNNTRITDCVVVRALLSGERPPGFSERFFTVLVVHAVAAVMTNLEPKHESVDRRAVAAMEPELLAFLTAEWHGGPALPDLERKYREKENAPASRASH